MNNKLVIWVVVCFAVSIGVVALLVAASEGLRQQPGSFLRVFPTHPVLEGDTLNIQYNTYYIAGGTPASLYLGNSSAPLHLLHVNLTTLDTQHVHLKVNGIRNRKFWSLKVQVDSPYYYLSDGAVPVVYKGNVYDWHAEPYLTDSIYFRALAPITDKSFLVKSLHGMTRENMLGKLTAWEPYQKFRTDILEKQLDGIFCTDGVMDYNKASNQFIYLYYYRNEFIVMDSSLTVLYKGHTIDTTSRAKIKVGTIDGTTHTLASPPLIVNYSFDTSGGWLFVHSGLLARNEPADAFNRGSVIDVYDLSDGRYRFSFYIYHFGGVKMQQFIVLGNRAVVLYDKLIRVFTLTPKYFTQA
jgi:hypothetical protein